MLAPTASTKKLIERIREVRKSREMQIHDQATSSMEGIQPERVFQNDSDEEREPVLKPTLKNCLNREERYQRLEELK